MESWNLKSRTSRLLIAIFLLLFPLSLAAEDGSRLWLRFDPLPAEMADYYRSHIVFKSHKSDTKLAMTVFEEAFSAMTGQGLYYLKVKDKQACLSLHTDKRIEGYRIETRKLRKGQSIHITGEDPTYVLYGVYHLLRLIQTHSPIEDLSITEIPAYRLRLLNHWDNLDGSVERGYAGHSLWKWDELPDRLSPRYEAYAKANASIGINGTVLNNVNASPMILSAEYLPKVAALADVFRPYGIRVYLSVNFSSPAILGGLPDSDPAKPEVAAWWVRKAEEIYSLIPDFGGFLVKANSEGQPGPHDFGRTHAQGANMLAAALRPFGGIVMWRAFVYDPGADDRAKQAYNEFMPLDGQFADNVIVQVKNGPIDFQPREPYNPLFGALRETPLMAEFQITQEYLGFANHLVFLAPLYQETLSANTFCEGPKSDVTVADITDGSFLPAPYTAIAGVSNIGESDNWCGYTFCQANWYAFGRLAWNHSLTSEAIAKEWIGMTLSNDEYFIEPIKDMMLTSRETAVDYMMPLGLHHIFAEGHHYGPEPWHENPVRPDWASTYYHRADTIGLGFDRTPTGSNAVSQYFPPLRDELANIATCPENLLLWFHHVPWDYKMKDGYTMWEELCRRYDNGVKRVRIYQIIWDMIEPYVDRDRFLEVQYKLKIQARDAVWWKDACLLYFQTYSRRPILHELERPIHDLEELMRIRLDMKHHN